MIGPIDRNLNITAVEEKLATDPTTGTTSISVPLIGATVISNVPCIHAREIVVMVSTAGNKINHVYLDIYGGARALMVSVDLGNVPNNTTVLYQYTGGAGETYDVRLVPDVGATIAEAWTCAR